MTRRGRSIVANDRGFLPKARREDLDERLRRRLEQWYSNAYEDDNLFLTLARRPGLMDAVWGFIRYSFGGESSVDPQLFETVRQRLAFNTECLHCSAVQVSQAAAEDEEERERILTALFDYEEADFPDATKAALRFADTLSGEHTSFSAPDYEDLRKHFSDEQILDLGMQCAFFIGWQRFNAAMGILPDSWQDGSVLPWQRPAAG
jgi:alkylhydroperoxidase family enzyme